MKSDFLAERALDLRSLLLDLVDEGFVQQEEANMVMGAHRTREQTLMHPLTYLASQELENLRVPGKKMDELTLTEWLAEKAGLPLFHIDPMKIPVAKVAEVMSYQFAKRHGLLCVGVTAEIVTIAVSQPFITEWEMQLAQTVRQQIKRVFARPSDLNRYRVEFYSLARSVSGAEDGGGNTRSGAANFEQLLELGRLKDPEANDQHVVNIVDWLLQYAFDQRASDIHLEPRREICRMRFRIDGVLHNIYEFPANVATAIVSRLKILGRMNVAEKRKPQDGRIKTKRPNGMEAELRLSTLPTAFGEKLVMRIFDPDVLFRTFEQLGLMGDDFKRWNSMTGKPHGILLVTGPTGSGKTTTLYSSLRQLATEQVNVSTIEDPIEMVEEAFNQTQVQHNIEFDFAAGIRTLMRQDPDIIMVGEIRDRETAQMAVQAALTGHLVLSTLHTNDAASAITRLLDLGVPSYLLRSTVLGVMAQRLIRTLCPHCKSESTISSSDWENLVRPWKVARPPKVYAPEGCLECRNTGYLGRQGIYEILTLTDSVQQHISDTLDLQAMRQQAMRDGMRTLRLSGAQKIAQGRTTLAEVLRVAPPPESS
ncbi:GspE/PulE family protein [Teredinibacter turnerae]|uniref:ATPase, PulE/Tfp pilus assembly n=1 Tax=Teredinibacter turnerae (strain ATCC 39867 / T7901) TaxID=377629 RepID=C5BMB7_TERTT|nr:GspE/PulE family protein [Teredinibacter turnerae]ACR12049.1 ATPase, PulE/Tfp pilus assembly [Teredinibacter turnerae T7901]